MNAQVSWRTPIELNDPADDIAADAVEPDCQLNPVAFAFLSDVADQIARRCPSHEFGHDRSDKISRVPLFTNDGQLRKLSEIESDVIRLALEMYGGNMTDVARHLGIGRSTIYRKVEVLDD